MTYYEGVNFDFHEVKEEENSIFFSKDTKRTYIFTRPLPLEGDMPRRINHFHTDFDYLGHPCGIKWIEEHPKKSP